MSWATATPRPCEVAGELSGMEVPLCSGSRQPRVREGFAGRIRLQSGQPVQAEPLLTEPHVTAQGSSGPTQCLQKPWSPALWWWQEIEDSSDEFFKFILMDYVACTFDVLDLRLGEEALDLRVVFGAGPLDAADRQPAGGPQSGADHPGSSATSWQRCRQRIRRLLQLRWDRCLQR